MREELNNELRKPDYHLLLQSAILAKKSLRFRRRSIGKWPQRTILFGRYWTVVNARLSDVIDSLVVVFRTATEYPFLLS